MIVGVITARGSQYLTQCFRFGVLKALDIAKSVFDTRRQASEGFHFSFLKSRGFSFFIKNGFSPLPSFADLIISSLASWGQ